MTYPHVQDPYDTADTAEPLVYTHFGQISAGVDWVIWPKGTQLRDCPPFRKDQHKPEQAVCRVTIMASPLPGRTFPFDFTRVMHVNSREWAAVTLASLKTLGVSSRELDGKFAQWQLKPASRYTDKSTGEEKQLTAYHFVAFYDSEAACIEAAAAFFGGDGETDVEQIPWGDEDEAPTPNDDGKEPDAERVALAGFLPALWAQCKGDVGEMAKLLATNSLLSPHFDIKSPEVQEVIKTTPF